MTNEEKITKELYGKLAALTLSKKNVTDRIELTNDELKNLLALSLQQNIIHLQLELEAARSIKNDEEQEDESTDKIAEVLAEIFNVEILEELVEMYLKEKARFDGLAIKIKEVIKNRYI